MVTARSQMLRAWLICLFFISISAYFSHIPTLRWLTSSALSYTDRARTNSRWLSSHWAYLIQLDSTVRFFRMLSSNSFRFLIWISASSASLVTFCLGGGGTLSTFCAAASWRSCSAVICTSAGILFFTLATFGTFGFLEGGGSILSTMDYIRV